MRATPQAAILFASLCIAAQADTITLIAPPGTLLTEELSVVETWTILGGTGSGNIIINNGLPPFASGSASGDPDDALGAEASVYFPTFGQRYESDFPGLDLGEGAGFPFTFGVPFTFESTVYLTSSDSSGLGMGIASVDYTVGQETYQVPSEFSPQALGSWGFTSPNDPDLSFVTLERSAVLLPEPNLIWACLAGLVGILARALQQRQASQGRPSGDSHDNP